MLVMTRKPGEAIAIGEGIVVKVMQIEGGRVQLGIDAPKEVRIRPVGPAEAKESQRK